jgi:hypothetical protein
MEILREQRKNEMACLGNNKRKNVAFVDSSQCNVTLKDIEKSYFMIINYP